MQATDPAAAPADPTESATEVAPELAQAAIPEAPAEAAAPTAAPDMGPAACAAALAQHFPALFGADQPPRPIKLRIQQDIQQRAPGVFSRRALGVFFHRHTTSTPYIKALVASDVRYDLDAQPAGDVAAEHKEAAQVELARRKALADERRAALRQAQRPQRQDRQERQGGQPRPDQPPPQAPADGQPPRAPRPPRPARPPGPGRTDRPDRPDRASRPQRPPRPPRPMHAEAGPRPAAPQRPAPAALPEPTDPALREQTLLVRAWHGSTLTKANFCALKRITEAELDAAVAQVSPRR